MVCYSTHVVSTALTLYEHNSIEIANLIRRSVADDLIRACHINLAGVHSVPSPSSYRVIC